LKEGKKNMPAQLANLILPIGVIAIFYFLVIRPQRKREKEIQAMRESVKVGDEIVTIGGIYGKIIIVKEDMITLEVGSTKTRLDTTKWAVGSVVKESNNKNEKHNEDNE